jgi:hypothetical protein
MIRFARLAAAVLVGAIATACDSADADAQDAPADAPVEAANRRYIAAFSNGATVELIGVTETSADPNGWRGPDGVRLAAAPYKPIQAPRDVWDSPMLREICWRWTGADGPDVRTSWGVEENTNGWGPVRPGGADGNVIEDLEAFVVPFTVIRPTCTLQFTISFPGSHWQAYHQDQAGYVSSYGQSDGTGLTFDKPRAVDGGTFIVMAYKFPDEVEARLVAIDASGKRQIGKGEPAGNLSGVRIMAVTFSDLQPGHIRSWLVERRTRVTETVKFQRVSLDAQTLTAVQTVWESDASDSPRAQVANGESSSAEAAELNVILEYGPVGEATLRGGDAGVDFIDLDAGVVMAPSAAELATAGPEWIDQRAIDAMGAVDSFLKGLRGLDMIVVRAEAADWDDPSRLTNYLHRATPGGSVPMDGGEAPATFFFQTREGTRGVLQIVDLTTDGAVKIRYRLATASARRD